MLKTYAVKEIFLTLQGEGSHSGTPAIFVRFEAGLLEDLGFGLDLSRCAVTGTMDDLVWVSPRTGRAVSAG